MDFEKICQSVEVLDPKIRFAGMINSKGRLVAGGMTKGQKPLENMKKDEMLYMELALRVRMRREFDDDLGPVKFSLSYRDKVIVMSFPIEENVLLVSADKNIDFSKIPFTILKLLGK